MIMVWALSIKDEYVISIASCTSPRVSERTLPISRVICWANCSLRCTRISAARKRISPRFGAGKLFSGLSITVEPGLYYPGVGGVRIEDVVIVGKTGVRNLTKVEEQLELR